MSHYSIDQCTTNVRAIDAEKTVDDLFSSGIICASFAHDARSGNSGSNPTVIQLGIASTTGSRIFMLELRPCTTAGLQRSARAYSTASASARELPEPTVTRMSPAVPLSVTVTARITRADFPGATPARRANSAV